MSISTLPQYAVNESVDFITRIDRRQASSMFALRMRGVLNRKKGMVCERDFGTIHRFGVYPIRPNTHKVVSGAADNGSGLIRITTSAVHGYSTDDIVYHAEIGGCTEANNIYRITVIDTTHYDLVGSTFTNAYTSGGICTDTPVDIYDCFILRDSDTGTEYEVLVGVDESSKTRIYTWDGTAWIEQTQKINAKINGAPSTPASTTTTQVVTIDTPTDEGGAVFTLGNDTLNGFVVYNSTKGTASIVLDSTATTITIPHDVTIAPHSWANDNDLVFFRCTGIYDGFNYANGTSPHVREMTVEAQKKMTIFYADNSSSTKVRKDPLAVTYQDSSRGLFPSVTGAVAATGAITSGGLETDGDTVEIAGYPLRYTPVSPSGPDQFDKSITNNLINIINAHPYLSTKVVASGDATSGSINTIITAVTAGVAGNSIALAETGGFSVSGATLTGGSDAANTGRISLAAGFYTEKAYFTTGFDSIGTIASPKTGLSASASASIGDGIQVSVAFSEATNSSSYTHLRIYVTVMYRGYQESDPICQIIVSGSTSAKFPTPIVSIRCDPALINKDITGFNIYIAQQTTAFASQSDWEEAPSEYLLLRSRDVAGDNNWSYNNSTQFCYSVDFGQVVESDYATLNGEGADDIATRLNHQPQTTRTALKPLFGIKVNRQQGAVQVVDQDDQTLRRSSYNGDGVHEDDNYPSVSVDEDDNLLHLPLSGSGEVLEMTLKNGIIHIHRKNEIETYNLFNNENDYLLERTTAEFAIHESPNGLVFASPSGIRVLPVGAGMAKTLNPLWDNFYDGTLLIDDDSASYITDAYREAMVSGYFSTLEEDWFACRVNIDAEDGGGSEYLVFRYSRKTSHWMVRKFHLGNSVAPNLTVATGQSEVRALKERSDGTMMVVTKRGLFKYPYTATRRYEDGVYSDGRSSDRGIPTDMTFNIGGLSNSIPGANILGVKVQHKGESINGDRFARIRTYRNDRVGAFETKRFRIDDPPVIREFERGGAVEAMMIRIDLPDDDSLEECKQFDISQIVFVYEQDQVPVASGR